MTQFIKVLLFCIFISPCLLAQEAVDTSVINKIRKEAFHHSQIPHIAHYLTEVSGARLTNSPGFKRAGTWAVDELKKWGLVNAKLEPYGEFGTGWEIEKCYAALTKPYYQTIIAYPKAWSGSTNGMIKASVVLLNGNDSTAIDKNFELIKNKIVILKDNDTLLNAHPFKAYATRYSDSAINKIKDPYMFKKEFISMIVKWIANQRKAMEKLKKAGALALIVKTHGSDGTAFVDGQYNFRKELTPTIPEIAIAKEDYLKLIRLAQSTKDVELEMEMRTKFYRDDTQGYNVVAEIPGTDPTLKSELVMLGGHLDSWHSGTGATDNAAGCTVMMEAVRIIKSLKLQPKRTIRIALWSGEEQGLIGSINYVKNHFGDQTTMTLKAEHSKISAYYNLDNGTGKIRGVYLQNNDAVLPIFKSWLQPFADLGANNLNSTNTGGTDHLSFDAVGIPGFQFIQDPIDYETRTHHSNMDTYDHLLIDDLKQAAAIVATFVYNTSVRKDKLPRKPMPKPEPFLFDLLK